MLYPHTVNSLGNFLTGIPIPLITNLNFLRKMINCKIQRIVKLDFSCYATLIQNLPFVYNMSFKSSVKVIKAWISKQLL